MDPVSPVAALIEDAQATFLRRHGVELKQADIARKSGLSSQRVSQLLTEPIRQVPPRKTIEAVASAIGVSYDEALRAFLEAANLLDVDGNLDLTRLAARPGRPLKTQGRDEQGI